MARPDEDPAMPEAVQPAEGESVLGKAADPPEPLAVAPSPGNAPADTQSVKKVRVYDSYKVNSALMNLPDCQT